MISLKKPAESVREPMQAYEQVVAGIKSKIYIAFLNSLPLKKAVLEINQRLESPDCKKNIQLVTHQILQSNSYGLQWLKKARDELDNAVDALSNALFTQTIQEPQTSFMTREVYHLIRRQYSSLKEEREELFVQKFWLQRKIFSPQRARAMAKNIFVRGDFKRLREAIRKYKKDEQKLAQNIIAYAQHEKIFQSRDWTTSDRSAFLQEKYWLIKQKNLLEVEKARLANLKFTLQQKQDELESLCQKSESVKKIEEIAAGILRKNLKLVRQLEETENQAKKLTQRMTHAKEQLDALKIRLDRDKLSTRYNLITPENSSTNTSAAATIADAILFDPQAVQLVARSTGNNLEMDKDWELMSELDKEEFLRKKIVREL